MTHSTTLTRDPAHITPPAPRTAPLPADFSDDIPLTDLIAPSGSIACLSEAQAIVERARYVHALEQDYGYFRTQAHQGDSLDDLDPQFERFRQGYRRHCLHYLASLAPPGASPLRRSRRFDTAESRRVHLARFRERARAAVTRILRPDLAPISSDRPVEGLRRLGVKLKRLLARLARMEQINAAHTKFLRSPASLEALGLSPEDKILVRDYRPKNDWAPHPFATHQFQNLRANIRRVRDQLQEFKVKAETAQKPEIEIACTGYRVRQNFALNRIQLLFPGKPPEGARSYLKGHGFRWAPSQNAWQRHLNPSIVHDMTAGRYRAELEKLLPDPTQTTPTTVN